MEKMDPGNSFLFSIVMAVYNAEAYLEEAFRSLEQQSLGFGRVQLILVDDGSTDRSGSICDSFAEKHPENVLCIHTENKGQSSARNLGLSAATGKYLNFMDSDDRISWNTLERVAAFLEEHDGETDVAVIPLRYFEAVEEEHWQNECFPAESSVMDLQTQIGFHQASANNAFFVRSRVGGIRFDEGMRYAEDTKYAMMCLAGRQKIGLVPGCYYDYRRRAAGNSTTQTLARNPAWTELWMEQFEFWAMDYFRKADGELPAWVQYALLCHLWNRMEVDRAEKGFLQSDAYLEKIRKVAQQIYPPVWSGAWRIPAEIRMALLALTMPDQKPEVLEDHSGRKICLGGIPLASMGDTPFILEGITIRQGTAELTGLVHLFPGSRREAYQPRWVFRGEEREIRLIPAEERQVRCGRIPLWDTYRFRESVQLKPGEPLHFSFRWGELEGQQEEPGRFTAGDFIPVLPVEYSTGWSGGWKYIVSEREIFLAPCATLPEKGRREIRWAMALMRRGEWKALADRARARILQAFSVKPAWIRDNQGKPMKELDERVKWNADLLYGSDDPKR